MTISKKLLLMATLALGLNTIGFAYDVNALSHETAQILDFAQELHKISDFQSLGIARQTLKVAQWLEQQVCDTYNVYDYDIIAIVNVINNHRLSMCAKVSVLSQSMATQRSEKIKRTINEIAAATLVGGFMGLAALAIIDDIKNPRPIVQITYKEKRWLPFVGYYYV